MQERCKVEAKLSPPEHCPFLISPIWCMSPDLPPVFNRAQVPLAEPPTLATKRLPLPWEQVPFKSSLTSFLCSWLSTRIFHDAIPYGVTGKELLKVSSSAWSKLIVLPGQSPSMPLTPAWPCSCPPAPPAGGTSKSRRETDINARHSTKSKGW